VEDIGNSPSSLALRWSCSGSRATRPEEPGMSTSKKRGSHPPRSPRERAEKTRHLEAEERFRQMADHAPVLVWMSGIDKLCTWFNKPWLEFTGRTMLQELGNGWSEGVHPEDLARCLETHVRSFDERVPFTMEYRLHRHDGEWRWVLDSGIPFFQENGTFAGYVGSCIDVTDRKNSEDALREREGRLQAVLNTAADSIITIDRRGRIIAANPATERMFGYTHDELGGLNVKLLMSPPYRDEHDGYIARYLQTGDARIIGVGREIVALRKDRSTFPVELAMSEIEHLGLFTGIIRDISARKQTEQELDHYRKNLRALASELMLAEERERERLAEDLHDGIGQALFRARMKLDQLSIAVPQVREVSTILEEIGKMTNTMTFELSPPVLRKLGLRSAIHSLPRDMQQRYALSVQVDDDGRDIPLNERAAVILFRALRELLINVAKHAETHRARISLRRLNRSLQVEVTDRGKGFDPVEQSRHVESGHFGLFSIRERLEYLGGTCKVQSAPGEGTKVILTVPLTSARSAGRSAV
jgi:PAS domain S-box-containing protein